MISKKYCLSDFRTGARNINKRKVATHIMVIDGYDFIHQLPFELLI